MDAKKLGGMSAAGLAATAAAAVLPGGVIFLAPAVGAIVAALEKSQSDLQDAEKKGVDSLEDEARKQRINMELQSHQAKVAQELAIAQRISSSETVEIEEFYDVSDEGNLGAKIEDSSFALGAAGKGKKVTKRVIKFSGSSLTQVVPMEKS